MFLQYIMRRNGNPYICNPDRYKGSVFPLGYKPNYPKLQENVVGTNVPKLQEDECTKRSLGSTGYEIDIILWFVSQMYNFGWLSIQRDTRARALLCS